MQNSVQAPTDNPVDLGAASELQLADILNRFTDAYHRGAPGAELLATFTIAQNFVRAHIQNEEAVMAAVAYPDLNRHRELHEQLAHNFSSVASRLQAGEDQAVEAAEQLLRTWLDDHFAGADRHFHEYLVAFHLRRLHAGLDGESRSDTVVHAEGERFRAMVEAAPNAILVVDMAGVICVVNCQAERLFGFSRTELLGKPVEMIVPQRLRTQHARMRNAYTAAPEVRAMGVGRELYGNRKDGTEVPIEIGLSPLQTVDGRFVMVSIIDISQRKEAERLVREAEAGQLRESIVNSLPASVIATDTEGTIVAINPACERLLGYSKEELVGKSAMLMHDPNEVGQRAIELSRQLGIEIPPGFQVIVAAGSKGAMDEREWSYVRKDGTTMPVHLAITTLRNQAGKISGFLKVANDITARKRAEDSLRHMAVHDALTGLPNRSLLADRLRMSIQQARRNNRQVAVLLLDLDQFKQINDSLGHQVGDELLLTIARRLQDCVREVDTVARLGGDEFVIVVNDIASSEDLEPLIGQISTSVSLPLRLERNELHVTPSIGGCLFPQDGPDAATLLKKADTAMYAAKAGGRATFRWFTEAMMMESQEKLLLGNALRHALELNELALHLQPQISLKTGRIIGMEALMRWQNGRHGDISPSRFIPILEETGMIVSFGEWALRTACQQCVEMQSKAKRLLKIAVNVSPRQFGDKHWVQTVKSALWESGLNPNHLELEITEAMLMQNPDVSARVLHTVRDLGVSIVVDDFGTGYSSLSYLTRFPIDKLKIDQSFVRDLATDSKDAAIVNAIIAMAKELKIEVVAEGVESMEQQNYLMRQGCDEVQGFHYTKGLPLIDLLQRFSCVEANIDLGPREPQNLVSA